MRWDVLSILMTALGMVYCLIRMLATTARKESEDARRHSDELLHLITNLVPHGIFAKDSAGRHIFAHSALAEMAGFSVDEILGKSDFDLVADKAQAEAYRADDLAVIESGKEMVISEEPRTDLSGRTRLLQTIKIPFTVAETGEPAVLGVCTDITERKRAEASLQESEERFRSMFSAAATGIAISTPDGRFLEANAAYCRMLGYTQEELQARTFAALTHPEDLAANLNLRDELLAGKLADFVMEKRYLKKNGDIVWTRSSVSAVRLAGGQITRLIVVAENITEGKRMESRLHRLNRLHAVLGNVGEAVLRTRDPQELYDAVCRIVMEVGKLRMVFVATVDAEAGVARPAAWCGEGTDCLCGPTTVIPMDAGPLGRGTAGTALRTGVPDCCNDIAGTARMVPWHETTRKHGLLATASFPFHLRGTTVGVLVLYAGETGYFLDDEMRLLLSVASDISLALEALEREQQRNQAEQQVHQLNAELEQRVLQRTAQLEAANKELEAFSYSVSHDLRAPLRAVNGFAGRVLKEFEPQVPADARQHLERIRNGTQRMGELIDDLLAFSRLSRESMSCRVVDSVKLVQVVVGESAPQREGRQIEINIGKLPDCHGDPALLKQVWFNLISNAIKYTGGRELAIIDIGCERKNNEDIFFVRDNGAGFNMKYANKLFGVFQRLHRADEFEGTGVGLAVVQRIIHRHGGRIWADAAQGRGATFYFTIAGETEHERRK